MHLDTLNRPKTKYNLGYKQVPKKRKNCKLLR